MTATLANSGDKSNRRELDFYPTPPEVTKALMDFLFDNKLVTKESLVWEPACGNGAMSNEIKKYVDDVHTTDIRNTAYSKNSVDFLVTTFDCDAVITNPPFNQSEEFIRHGLKQAPVVCMLLKSQYWHAKKRFSLFSEFQPSFILPLTWRPDFLFDQRENGKTGSPTMDVQWVVWDGSNKGYTEYFPLLKNQP